MSKARDLADSVAAGSVLADGVVSLSEVGGGTNNGVVFVNGGGTTTSGSALTFDGTNVGIGTSSPDSRLDVRGTLNASTSEIIATFARPDAAVKATIENGASGDNGITLGTTTGHPLALQTNDTERVRITSAGSVGIGTSSPSTALDVFGGIRATSSGGYNQITTTSIGDAVFNNNGNNWLTVKDGVPADAMRIDTAGNVGIGTSSPSTKLNVSSGAPVFRLTDTDTALSDNELSSGIEFYQSDEAGAGVGASISAYGQGSTGLLNLRFATGANTEAMRITSAGKVGIGTSSPSHALDIQSIGDTNLQVKALSSGAGNDDDVNLILDAAETGETRLLFRQAGVDKAYIEWFDGGSPDFNFVTAAGTDGVLDFQPNNTLAMRIDSAGNVGIGTSSPTYKLQVQSGLYSILAGADSGLLSLTDATQKVMRFGVPHYTNAEEPVTGMFVSNVLNESAVFIGGGTGVFNAATRVSFYTAANTTTTTGSERMRIDSSGNVGIGTSSPATKLVLAGNNTGLTENNTLRFWDTDSVTETNQQIGKIEFFSSDASSPGGSVKAYIGAFARDTTPDAYLSFATDTTTGTPIERMRITNDGNLQFNSGYGSVATAYGCRAWVNFASGPTIRASGNVSSVSQLGGVSWDINFSTALPDVNYTTAGSASDDNISGIALGESGANLSNRTTSKVRVILSSGVTRTNINVAIFR
jgi:hypothetical protein